MTDTAEIEQAALAARLTLSEVFRQAGVAPSAFYNARRSGTNMRPLTKAKIMDAIRELAG